MGTFSPRGFCGGRGGGQSGGHRPNRNGFCGGCGSSRRERDGQIGCGNRSKWKCTYCGGNEQAEDYCWEK